MYLDEYVDNVIDNCSDGSFQHATEETKFDDKVLFNFFVECGDRTDRARRKVSTYAVLRRYIRRKSGSVSELADKMIAQGLIVSVIEQKSICRDTWCSKRIMVDYICELAGYGFVKIIKDWHHNIYVLGHLDNGKEVFLTEMMAEPKLRHKIPMIDALITHVINSHSKKPKKVSNPHLSRKSPLTIPLIRKINKKREYELRASVADAPSAFSHCLVNRGVSEDFKENQEESKNQENTGIKDQISRSSDKTANSSAIFASGSEKTASIDNCRRAVQEAIEKAKDKNRAAIDRKQQKKRAPNAYDVLAYFDRCFEMTYGVKSGGHNIKDKKLAKLMLGSYDFELIKIVLYNFFKRFDILKVRWKICSDVITVGIIWGWREQMFTVAQMEKWVIEDKKDEPKKKKVGW